VVPLTLFEPVVSSRQPAQQLSPVGRRERAAGFAEDEAPNPVLESVDRLQRPDDQLTELEPGQHLELPGGIAAICGEQSIPERNQRALVLASELFVSPDGGIVLGSQRLPLVE
jgi:hypothetical protein